MSLSPPLTSLNDLPTQMQSAGYAVLDAASLSRLTGVPAAQLRPGSRCGTTCRPTRTCATAAATASAGTAASSSSGAQVAAGAAPRALAAARIQRAARRHRALVRAVAGRAGCATPTWPRLLAALGGVRRRAARRAAAGSSRRTRFASTPTDGIGRPTPEGAHRDGVDLVRGDAGRPPQRQGRRDARLRRRGPAGRALHAEPSRGARCCSTTRA